MSVGPADTLLPRAHHGVDQEDDDENDIAWLDLGTATVHEPSGSSIFEIKPNGSVHDGGEDERFQLVKYTHHHMKLAAAFLMLLAPKFSWS